MAEQELDQSIARLQKVVNQRIEEGHLDHIDDMSVRELKLHAVNEAESLVANDEKASIVSVVVYVAVT